MREAAWVAVHRGGLLRPLEHRLLAIWAANCAERVLPIFEALNPTDKRPHKAIATTRAWAMGNGTVGEARRASLEAHEAARESAVAAQFAARAAGHAVATAHMADHALGAAWYALKALRITQGEEAVALETLWQQEHLPTEVRGMVLELAKKPKFRSLWPDQP